MHTKVVVKKGYRKNHLATFPPSDISVSSALHIREVSVYSITSFLSVKTTSQFDKYHKFTLSSDILIFKN